MSTTIWTFSDIQKLSRQISGQLSAVSFSDTDNEFNINTYYQYDLPRELKIEEFYTQYTFPTEPNVSVYPLPGDFANGLAFTHVIPKIFINGTPIFYTQDTDVYYQRTPKLFSTELMGTGNGVQETFPYTTMFQPIVPNQPASVIGGIFNAQNQASGEQFSDNGNGNLIGTLGGSGTVNYLTGVINFTFSIAPPINTTINVTYHYEQLGRPNTCLFYARNFNFYPTPNAGYQVRIDAFMQPLAMVDPDDVPLKPEWGEIIALGGALKTLRNFGQTQKYNEIMQFYKVERTKLMSDTDNQLMASRSRQMI